jgi:hypothetical protein
VDDIVVVEIVDGVEDLTDRLGRILLRELALFADPVEQLSARRQLGDDVVFVLRKLGPLRKTWTQECSPSTQTSRGT